MRALVTHTGEPAAAAQTRCCLQAPRDRRCQHRVKSRLRGRIRALSQTPHLRFLLSAALCPRTAVHGTQARQVLSADAHRGGGGARTQVIGIQTRLGVFTQRPVTDAGGRARVASRGFAPLAEAETTPERCPAEMSANAAWTSPVSRAARHGRFHGAGGIAVLPGLRDPGPDSGPDAARPGPRSPRTPLARHRSPGPRHGSPRTPPSLAPATHRRSPAPGRALARPLELRGQRVHGRVPPTPSGRGSHAWGPRPIPASEAQVSPPKPRGADTSTKMAATPEPARLPLGAGLPGGANQRGAGPVTPSTWQWVGVAFEGPAPAPRLLETWPRVSHLRPTAGRGRPAGSRAASRRSEVLTCRLPSSPFGRAAHESVA